MNLQLLNLVINNVQRPFHYRADSVGDHGVIRQIFEEQSYNFNRWVHGHTLQRYHQAHCSQSPSLIIDAGANIGAASVYFHAQLDNIFIYAIEPNDQNWQLCTHNTQYYDNHFTFHGAIASSDGQVQLLDPGHSDWGYRTEAITESDQQRVIVPAISPETILNHPQLIDMTPLILKIDIEGAEQELFSADCAWMNRFPLLIIELHDWLLPFTGCSRPFIQAVANDDFDIVQYSENLFLFNRRLLAPFHN